MTATPAVAHFVLAATSKSSSSSLLTLLPLVAIGLLGATGELSCDQIVVRLANERTAAR